MVLKALNAANCTKLSDDGKHTKWGCPCGKHTTAVTRHRNVTPGVIRNIINDLDCLPKGWLQ